MSDDPTTTSTPLRPTDASGPDGTAWTAPVSVEPVTVAPPAKGRSSSSGRALNILLGLAVAVAIGGVAFAVGRSTAPVSAASNGFVRDFNGANGAAPSGAPLQGQAGGPGFIGRGGGLTIDGTVTAVSGDTLTIQTEDGNSVEVTTGADTDYHTQADASASDVTTGSTVKVQVDFGGGPRTNGQGGANGQNGQNGSGGPVGTASDVTVVP